MHDFIIIDDSKLDCMIVERLVQSIVPDTAIAVFNDARAALDHLQQKSWNANERTVLLVDIQMPLMNGFQFMEAFTTLPEGVQKQCLACLLTSSVAPSDEQRAGAFPVLGAYFQKPLTKIRLKEFLDADRARYDAGDSM